MKTKFTTIIASLALLVATNFTAAKADNGVTSLPQIGNISKIEASGNVDVYLVNGDYDGVKVYDNYYSQNAVVRNDEGVLRIASYATEKLVVFVTVNDLKEITANDNATVRTSGDALAVKGLNINLNNHAVAQLDIDAVAAIVNVKDEARVKLVGAVYNYELNYADVTTVNNDDLQTYVSRKNKIEQPKPGRIFPMALRMHANL